MHGHDERPGDQMGGRGGGRHRDHRLSAPVALGVTVAALLGAFGVGAALLPQSVTGSGVQPEAYAMPLEEPGGVAVEQQEPPAEPAPSAESSAPAEPPSAAPPSPAPPKASTPAAKPPPKRAKPAEVPADQESQENEVIRLVNVERAKAGCQAVNLNTDLRTSIRQHLAELGSRGGLYISHVSADGRSFVERAKQQGYTAAGGENVARGQRDAAAVMHSWMNSTGHRANIVNCSFRVIGVGMVEGVDGTLVWGQVFGRA